LRVFLKSGEFTPRMEVLTAIEHSDDVRADEMLVDTFANPDRTSGWMLWGDIRNPRLCDIAGIYLARRFKLEGGRFHWPEENIEEKNRNLSEIWKVYRERKGLPPAPFVAPCSSPAKR